MLHSQDSVHTLYGGIVPEFASRAHIEAMDHVLRNTLQKAELRLNQLHAVAVTEGPGLIGSLIVGLSFGKALAYSSNLPLITVNHLEGHLASTQLNNHHIPFPHIGLLVSGGHTNLYVVDSPGHYQLLGKTLDDAAGEAFDKGAKMLGLGFPGGPMIDQLAKSGDPLKATFPLPYPSTKSFDFSFSGIKTSLRYFLQSLDTQNNKATPADIAAGYQASIIEVLVQKTIHAAIHHGIKDIAIVGGVAANSLLRETIQKRSSSHKLRIHLPPLQYCTDNGAMIAAAAWHGYLNENFASLNVEPFSQQLQKSSKVNA